VRIHPNVGICRKYGSHRNGRPEVRERIYPFTIIRHCQTKFPNKVGNKEDDSRLVKAVQHVEPKLCPRVLQASDTTNI
jgi:hypothetical protein